MKDIEFTALENRLLLRSGDMKSVEKRRGAAIATGVFFIALLSVAACYTESWRLLLSISIAYIVITVVEKILYLKGVRAYKTIIQKLCKRLNELDK